MMEKIAVQNLKCGGCANTITQKIGDLPFVNSVAVDHNNSIVSLEMADPNKLDEVKKALSKLGYPEVLETNTIGKKAKSFMSCAVGRMS